MQNHEKTMKNNEKPWNRESLIYVFPSFLIDDTTFGFPRFMSLLLESHKALAISALWLVVQVVK